MFKVFYTLIELSHFNTSFMYLCVRLSSFVLGFGLFPIYKPRNGPIAAGHSSFGWCQFLLVIENFGHFWAFCFVFNYPTIFCSELKESKVTV